MRKPSLFHHPLQASNHTPCAPNQIALGASALFSLGHVIATPAALAPIKEHGVLVRELLHRHLTGDWQEMCQQDQDANKIKKPIGQRFPTANPVFSPRSTLTPKARPASPSWSGT